MAATIKIKNSSTASAVPTSSDLVQGELAVNVADKRIFTENASGTVVELGTNPSTLTVTAGATIQGLTVGKGAGSVATNTAVGASALNSNTTGAQSVSVGYQAAYTNTAASNLTAVGYQAGYNTTTSSDNLTAVGWKAAFSNTSGASLTALGRAAAYSHTTGSDNTAVGLNSMYYTTTGSNNVSVGSGALQSNTTASYSTAVGYQAGYTSNANAGVFVGYQAGYVTTGLRSTFVGTDSGSAVTSGTKNTIIGCYTGNQGGLDIRTSSNYIVLSDGDGNPAAYRNSANTWFFGDASNQCAVVIQDSRSGVGTLSANNTNASYVDWVFTGTTTRAGGTSCGFFRGIANSSAQIYIYNNGNIVNTNNSYGSISDVKLKENIVDATPKLDALMQVRVVNYNLKSDVEHKQLGVIAQELEQVFPAMIEETVDRDEEGNDLGTTTKSVKYSVFVPMLIKAIQELKAEFDAYKEAHP